MEKQPEVVEHFIRQWKESGEWDLVALAFRQNGLEPTEEDILDALKDIYLDIWAWEDAHKGE